MFPTASLLKVRIPLGGFVNARILKDHAKRVAFEANEEKRQALRFPPLPHPNGLAANGRGIVTLPATRSSPRSSA